MVSRLQWLVATSYMTQRSQTKEPPQSCSPAGLICYCCLRPGEGSVESQAWRQWSPLTGRQVSGEWPGLAWLGGGRHSVSLSVVINTPPGTTVVYCGLLYLVTTPVCGPSIDHIISPSVLLYVTVSLSLSLSRPPHPTISLRLRASQLGPVGPSPLLTD